MKPTTKRRFKNALFDELARVGKALASGRRLELVDVLAQGERTVEELAHETAQSVANTSRNLQVLREAHLVEARRARNYMHYRLADDQVTRLWLCLRGVGETRIAEVQRLVRDYLQEREGLQAMDARELRRRLQAGRVTVVDVRPVVEYQAGHIAGARSIPAEELRRRLDELPKSNLIVAYCRGPYCVFADEAVALLARQGFRAVRLEGGYPDWKFAGGRVAAGAAG